VNPEFDAMLNNKRRLVVFNKVIVLLQNSYDIIREYHELASELTLSFVPPFFWPP
jgi:hypothetical protein